MRLINCSTLKLEEFIGTNIPRYAILSHTWGDEEVSFADFTSGQPTVRSGYQKIIFTCQQAIKDKIGYAWVDTCCIDKSSSAELSEAINSMFAWYQKSVRCYAYLFDVSEANVDQEFPKSRWFTRGWTLQEMLAPTTVILYDQQWVELGYLEEYAEEISKITGIDGAALWRKVSWRDPSLGLENKFGSYCVATRMSWASTRQTTRPEDMAYCLLGIFNINMPLLYGEGDRAFRRLQEEIIRKSDDDSILAWALSPEDKHTSLLGLLHNDDMQDLCDVPDVDFLARSPEDFKDCAGLTRATEPLTLFTLTNTGLQIQLPIVQVFERRRVPGNALARVDVPNRYVGNRACNDEYDCHMMETPVRVWIGLLGCSRVSSQNFLGILLSPSGDEKKPNVRVVRQRYLYGTVLVGPRVAFGSVSKTVTIAGLNGFQEARYADSFGDYQRIIVNECKAIRKFGYQVQGCSAWDIGMQGESPLAYRPLWDPKAKILTIREDDPYHNMYEFSFERSSGGQNHKFTVFVTQTGMGAVREGDVFSEDERFALYDLLGDNDDRPDYENRVHDKGEVLVHDDKQRWFHVRVEVHFKVIGHHELTRVNVDALRDGFVDTDHRWDCNCEKHVYPH